MKIRVVTCVWSHVCDHMCVVTCVWSHVLVHMCETFKGTKNEIKLISPLSVSAGCFPTMRQVAKALLCAAVHQEHLGQPWRVF